MDWRKIPASTVRVMRKRRGLDRPSCLVLARRDCLLVRACALYGAFDLIWVGPVTPHAPDVAPATLGTAALAALAAYRAHPQHDAPPADMDPVLSAAG